MRLNLTKEFVASQSKLMPHQLIVWGFYLKSSQSWKILNLSGRLNYRNNIDWRKLWQI